MNKTTAVTIGFFAGIVIGALISTIAPEAGAVITLPLKWLTKNFHPFPSESLANLIFAWPLWFAYWGGIGVVVAFITNGLFAGKRMKQ